MNTQKTLVEEYKQKLIKETKKFCDEYLNQEYYQLYEKMIEKMARKRVVPFLSGRGEIWLAAIIYAIGSVNFLFDPSFKPYVSTDDICNYFGVSKSTTAQKVKVVRDMFKMSQWKGEFFTNHMKETNSFLSNVFLDGMPIPISSLPEELQKVVKENPGEKLTIWNTKKSSE